MHNNIKGQDKTLKSIVAFFILFSLLFFLNCNNINKIKVKSIKIDSDKPTSLNVSLCEENIKIIDLSSIQTLIGNIDIIELFNDYVILYDGKFRLFDLVSKKNITLANKGNGPNEYLSITSIKASKSGVYYTDRRKKTLSKVSFDGNPIFEIDINSNPSDFTLLNDSIVAFYHGSFPLLGKNYRISIFDINKKTHCSLNIPYPKKHWNFLHFDDWNNFSNYNGNIILSYSGSNRIYTFDDVNNEFLPLMDFDFGAKSLTNDILDKDYDEVFNFAHIIDTKEIFCRVLSSYETKNFIIFSTKVGSSWYIYTFNKTTQESYIYNSLGINNSTSLILNYDLIPKGYCNGYLLFILEPINLMKNPQLLNILSSYNLINPDTITSTSNPIIIMINENSFSVN
ncbi:MAG: 6-bladed beta-propeller [Bacteroidales bacterium]|jgi:hypothetical protein|nr:6-bladed beta-propeller [Bacteroidales bacterium]